MVLGKGSLLSLSEQKEKGISVSQGIVVTECFFKISYARVILDHRSLSRSSERNPH